MQAPANSVRGETSISLEGVAYAMRPSFEAIVEFEDATGRSASELYGLAVAKRLKAREIAAIIGACVRAKGRQDADRTVSAFQDARINQLITGEPGGLMGATQTLIGLLHKAATGGVTSTGEAKPATMTSRSTSGNIDAGSPASPLAFSAGLPTPSGEARPTTFTGRSRRGAKPTPPKTIEQPAGWSITLDGVEHPLRITLEAFLAIELLTGQPLFRHLEAAAARNVTLDDLATILRCLLGPAASVPGLAGPEWQYAPAEAGLPPLLLPDMVGNREASAAILRVGLVNVLAIVMTPLLYALRGGITDEGDPKPGFVVKV